MGKFKWKNLGDDAINVGSFAVGLLAASFLANKVMSKVKFFASAVDENGAETNKTGRFAESAVYIALGLAVPQFIENEMVQKLSLGIATYGALTAARQISTSIKVTGLGTVYTPQVHRSIPSSTYELIPQPAAGVSR